VLPRLLSSAVESSVPEAKAGEAVEHKTPAAAMMDAAALIMFIMGRS